MNREVIISDGTLDNWYAVISGEKHWEDVHVTRTPDIRNLLLMSIDYIRELRKELDKYEKLGKPGHDVAGFYKDSVNEVKDTLYDYQNEESIPESCDIYLSEVYFSADNETRNPKTCFGRNFYMCSTCMRKI